VSNLVQLGQLKTGFDWVENWPVSGLTQLVPQTRWITEEDGAGQQVPNQYRSRQCSKGNFVIAFTSSSDAGGVSSAESLALISCYPAVRTNQDFQESDARIPSRSN
jgi:hypothetical protein